LTIYRYPIKITGVDYAMFEKNETGLNPMQKIFVTRLPIFDKKKDVFAYELLFESNIRTGFDSIEKKKDPSEDSTFSGVSTLLINDLRRISNGKRAVIHFNRQMLLSGFPMMFPSEMLGIELKEDSDPENKIARIVKKMKKAGYLVFVTDYLFNNGNISLIKLADIVGVDFRSKGLQKRSSLFEGEAFTPRFLAKNIETAADFDTASEVGYQYFQGGFFNKADIISFRDIPSYKLNLMRILKEINKPSVQFDHIEKILQKDVSITYKLLRFVNSASFGFKTTVHSIRHALTLLGEKEIRKWLSFIVLSSVGTDKPLEMIRSTIIRAKFCEFLGGELDYTTENADFFLMGMFSMVDVFLDRPMEEVLNDLPLAPPVKAALLGKPNTLCSVLELVRDYERGDWRHLHETAKQLNLKQSKIAGLYLDAIEWGKFL